MILNARPFSYLLYSLGSRPNIQHREKPHKVIKGPSHKTELTTCVFLNNMRSRPLLHYLALSNDKPFILLLFKSSRIRDSMQEIAQAGVPSDASCGKVKDYISGRTNRSHATVYACGGFSCHRSEGIYTAVMKIDACHICTKQRLRPLFLYCMRPMQTRRVSPSARRRKIIKQ